MSEQVKGKKSPLIFYGWVVVATSFVTMTIGYATRYSFSVFYVAILDEFGWSRAETALAFSVNMLAYAVLSPVAGALVDRFGPRRVFPVGAVICGLGVLGLSQLNSIWQLYLFAGVMAVGLVFIGYIAHSCILPHWFSMKLGTALGIAVVGITVGNVSTIPIQSLIDNIGWRGAYIVLSIVVVAIIVPLTAIFQRHKAQDMGLPLDGISRGERRQTEPSQEEPEDIEDLRVVDKEWAAIDWTLARAMKTRRFWWFFIQTIVMGIKTNIILVHIVAFTVDVGYSKMFGASIYALAGALGVVSAIGGYVSDRIGREWTYTLGSIAMLLGIAVLMPIRDASSPWLLYLFAVLYGVGVGIERPMTMAAKGDVFPGKHLGIIMGVNNLSYGVGGALGPWLAGYIFDVTGSYNLAFYISILSLVVAIALMWMASPGKVRVVGGKVRQRASYS